MNEADIVIALVPGRIARRVAEDVAHIEHSELSREPAIEGGDRRRQAAQAETDPRVTASVLERAASVAWLNSQQPSDM
jgi:hypothetical protein